MKKAVCLKQKVAEQSSEASIEDRIKKNIIDIHSYSFKKDGLCELNEQEETKKFIKMIPRSSKNLVSPSPVKRIQKTEKSSRITGQTRKGLRNNLKKKELKDGRD